eukprot:GHVR01094340.1.p1 GENE.GHVR01094340.1~~GHVR01094340.1.p1  ORF type:complete len:279 (-),score=35.52 GHVR01094340.1:115-951(-)
MASASVFRGLLVFAGVIAWALAILNRSWVFQTYGIEDSCLTVEVTADLFSMQIHAPTVPELGRDKPFAFFGESDHQVNNFNYLKQASCNSPSTDDIVFTTKTCKVMSFMSLSTEIILVCAAVGCSLAAVCSLLCLFTLRCLSQSALFLSFGVTLSALISIAAVICYAIVVYTQFRLYFISADKRYRKLEPHGIPFSQGFVWAVIANVSLTAASGASCWSSIAARRRNQSITLPTYTNRSLRPRSRTSGVSRGVTKTSSFGEQTTRAPTHTQRSDTYNS